MRSSMDRILQVLMLVTVLGQAVGLPWLASTDACSDDCPDDAKGRNCPPICPSCVCSVRLSPTVPGPQAVLTAPVPPVLVVAVAERWSSPPTPEPQEILHVPKLLTV